MFNCDSDVDRRWFLGLLDGDLLGDREGGTNECSGEGTATLVLEFLEDLEDREEFLLGHFDSGCTT